MGQDAKAGCVLLKLRKMANKQKVQVKDKKNSRKQKEPKARITKHFIHSLIFTVSALSWSDLVPVTLGTTPKGILA